MSFKEFQDGGHLGYRNGTILPILNLLNVATMSPTKFQLIWFWRRCRKCEKLTTVNRSLHKLTCCKAPGELIIIYDLISRDRLFKASLVLTLSLKLTLTLTITLTVYLEKYKF